jgi:hypothetical protein
MGLGWRVRCLGGKLMRRTGINASAMESGVQLLGLAVWHDLKFHV